MQGEEGVIEAVSTDTAEVFVMWNNRHLNDRDRWVDATNVFLIEYGYPRRDSVSDEQPDVDFGMIPTPAFWDPDVDALALPDVDMPRYEDVEGLEVHAGPQKGSTAVAPVPATTGAGGILQEALDIVQGARNTTHGEKERSFQVIGDLWATYLNGKKGADYYVDVTPFDVAQMMVLLKIARSIQGVPVRDHFVDAAGYSAIAGELA